MSECKTHSGLYFNTDGYSTKHRIPTKGYIGAQNGSYSSDNPQQKSLRLNR